MWQAFLVCPCRVPHRLGAAWWWWWVLRCQHPCATVVFVWCGLLLSRDVPDALVEWRNAGIKTYIYSSGSREAQVSPKLPASELGWQPNGSLVVSR